MTYLNSKPLALVVSILAMGPLLTGAAAISSAPAFAEVTISTSGDVWDEVTEDGAEVSAPDTSAEGGGVETATGDTCEDVSALSLRVSRC